MTGLSPAPLKSQPGAPWRVTLGANTGDASGRIGASFSYNRNVLNSSVTTVVTPAANANGLILRSYFCANAINSDVNPILFADTAAPSGYSDTTKRPIAQHAQGTPVYPNIFVPAGHGLYLVAGANGFVVGMTWDLL